MDDNPDPGSREHVLISFSQVVIGGTSYYISITSSHILLADTESGERKGSIPLPSISHVLSTANRLREPVIRLTVTDPEGGSQEIDLIFPHIAGGADIRNRDAAIAVFTKLRIPVTVDPWQETMPVLSGKESRDRGTRLADDSVVDRTTVPDWTHFGISYSSKSIPDEPEPYSPLVTITAVILLAAICIAAMVMPLPVPKEGDTLNLPAADRSLHPITPVITTKPVTTTTVTVPVKNVPVPGKGVYVKISCTGNYSGFISTAGWRMDVNSSGTQLYELPVQNTRIDIVLEKLDSSTDLLDVELYNGGISVAHQDTSQPNGRIEMHITVGPAVEAIGYSPPAASETVATTQPTAAPVQYAIPTTGVWVHVVYPGNYSGTLNANGITREIDSSGDQIYQMVMKNGTIDGILEKSDGSSGLLQIDVYKDSVQIDHANTTMPRGTAEIHTRL